MTDKTVEDASQNKRLKRLTFLAVGCGVCVIFFTELTPYLPRTQGIDWWFWVLNSIVAVAACLGILFSFWWAGGETSKRKPFFICLCFFLLFFVGNATRGLVTYAYGNEVMAEFQGIRGSCQSEVAICHALVNTTEPDKRQDLASSFYGITGVNVFGNKAAGNLSVPPNDQARLLWSQKQELDNGVNDTAKVFTRLGNYAQNAFALNAIVAIAVFGFGGFWLGRRKSSD